jgi:hypothetical protein
VRRGESEDLIKSLFSCRHSQSFILIQSGLRQIGLGVSAFHELLQAGLHCGPG